MEKDVILEVRGMRKCFGSTIALKSVDITIHRGKITGLIGENGSGKSTVTSIIAGMQPADQGEMIYRGERWNPSTMEEALEHGIGMIVQESGTVPGISVAENIFLGEAGKFKRGLVIRRKALLEEAQKSLAAIGADEIRADMPTGMLDMQSRKLIEIAKIMKQNPELLIVDETTTALSQQGREILYRIVNRMRDENKAVIFISHDLDEIMEVCDELTVLRDGDIIRTFAKEEFDPELIKTSMIGRELTGDYYRSDGDGSYDSEVVMELVRVDSADGVKNLSLQLHKGEILGIGGLSACGMHTVGKLLFGAEKPIHGEVLVHGQKLKSEAEAMRQHIGYVSKDRDFESLCLNAPIADNIAAGGLDQIAKKGILVLPEAEKQYVERQIHELSIKCRDRRQYVSELSGGNKQKVVFGKWIGRGSEILILDCPTRGIDIGVKQAMYQLMYRMKLEGKSIVIISEEMMELLGMSDHIIIMKDGKRAGEFFRNESPQESDLITCMI